jgi:F-type H+-transporting ATPase subunit epsilon
MFKLSIVTPEKISYENEVQSLIVPGIGGYLGVLSNHAPLITAITPGKVSVKDSEGKELIMAVSDGFFEVSANHATLLVDSVEYAGEIDLERAREALERARKRMRDSAGEIDLPRARRSYERAKNRLHVADSSDS